MRKLFFLGLPIAFLFAVSLVSAQDGPPAGPPGLDPACAGLEGADRGACVSDIAQGQGGPDVSNPIAEAARQLVDGCRDLEGAAFGACVSAAARAPGDADAQDQVPHAARPL